jgi:hypothetical protein
LASLLEEAGLSPNLAELNELNPLDYEEEVEEPIVEPLPLATDPYFEKATKENRNQAALRGPIRLFQRRLETS